MQERGMMQRIQERTWRYAADENLLKSIFSSIVKGLFLSVQLKTQAKTFTARATQRHTDNFGNFRSFDTDNQKQSLQKFQAQFYAKQIGNLRCSLLAAGRPLACNIAPYSTSPKVTSSRTNNIPDAKWQAKKPPLNPAACMVLAKKYFDHTQCMFKMHKLFKKWRRTHALSMTKPSEFKIRISFFAASIASVHRSYRPGSCRFSQLELCTDTRRLIKRAHNVYRKAYSVWRLTPSNRLHCTLTTRRNGRCCCEKCGPDRTTDA